ncbi:tetratricopeptide repeat protein [Afifella marina]|uniref:Tetratricopeptide repeat-containing protein n=1 Tax=Afifella marina DSM 2698 TaxID=1120955 RepID=A0A1G5MES1_AFIMA|nr:tetratricopeptide repeat protein [Afifella marina]MBK1625253.1 tetratricopeptide repeat-containing protein [Afifella marina DSM 2698]MBK1628970.1 tetratricopeptide repeat-containing protein [Afifella marina]MBK5918349.1 hypothetical protein [Afifella marina]RAI22864.1 hypothetical protein CH311_04225 [Afifella marina DSM 2698]SCZ23626.1 hypothetical protein SAMN03080610_00572 [Afifella marina DSM 2698]
MIGHDRSGANVVPPAATAQSVQRFLARGIRFVLLLSALLFATLPGTHAMTAGANVEFEQVSPHNDEVFVERVADMRRHLDDPDARFSASEAMQALRVLRSYAGEREDLLGQRREILSMMGRIVNRAPLMEFEDGLKPLAELMAIGIGEDRPPQRRLYDHFTYAELASGYATLPGNKAWHSLAADQYGAAALIADTLATFSEDQSAGLRQDQAYELHEAGRYEEALAINRSVLAIGERLHGPTASVLASVLTNIAQNLHALERREDIEPYLIRVQEIGENDKDLDRVQDMLFQRGVLAYERGNPEKARALMLERIARLEEAEDQEHLAEARIDYEELERRIRVGDRP